MQRIISSQQTSYYKRIFPALYFSVLPIFSAFTLF